MTNLPEDMRERVKAQIVNAYSLGCGNTMTGNKINEHEDLESYTKTIMALIQEKALKFNQDGIHNTSYFKGELNILKSYVYIFDQKYTGIPAIEELRNKWREDNDKIKEALARELQSPNRKEK